MFFSKKLSKEKKQYFEHRMYLSNNIRHAISMWHKENVEQYRAEIDSLDESIKLLFNK